MERLGPVVDAYWRELTPGATASMHKEAAKVMDGIVGS
jgi:hypothetical protein